MTVATQRSRVKIFQMDAKVLEHNSFAGCQYIIKLSAENIAKEAQAGSFVHIQCSQQYKLRRPISIMRAHKKVGTIELLYKKVGKGTGELAEKTVGDTVSILGPIGRPFAVSSRYSLPLLIGGGVGMPPMIFLSEMLVSDYGIKPVVILGSEVPFPFDLRQARIGTTGIPAESSATMPLLDDWGLVCRLASFSGYPGVCKGYVTDLAKLWLDSLSSELLGRVTIYSCGPEPMLEAVHRLAVEYNLLCQVSLEEFMACGVGGCAGCVVKVVTDKGPAMKRVCVDGPVFESRAVFI